MLLLLLERDVNEINSFFVFGKSAAHLINKWCTLMFSLFTSPCSSGVAQSWKTASYLWHVTIRLIIHLAPATANKRPPHPIVHKCADFHRATEWEREREKRKTGAWTRIDGLLVYGAWLILHESDYCQWRPKKRLSDPTSGDDIAHV
jgi:hypothetical protein